MRTGEAYRPTRVDILLGNPEVVLRNSDGKVVKRGASAQDLSNAPPGDYIDLQDFDLQARPAGPAEAPRARR